MAYTFDSTRLYRMPTHFGPSLGPRQGLDGRRFSCIDSPKITTIRAAFGAQASELEKYLPLGFSLRAPNVVYLTFMYVTDLEWLGGRGYNTFGVSTLASYQGQYDAVDGELLLVLWENMADPIITGREDLGFAKVYCEIPEAQFTDGNVMCRAGWDGCQFATLQLANLKVTTVEALPPPPPSDGILHYKYIPKTGVVGEADVEYAVLTPAAWPNRKTNQAMIAEDAACHFRQSTWEELPTLVHIVNALSGLSLGDCVEATLVKSYGGKDLSDQKILT